MGTSGVILKSRMEYSPEKFLGDITISTFLAELMLNFKNQTKFFDDGSFAYTQCNIIEKTNKITDDTAQVIFSVVGINKEHVNKYNDIDTGFDWVERDRKLYQIGYVEDVFGAEEIIFRFVYEYLKLNPKDYFWLDSYEWVYSFEDLEKLSKLPLDPDWCYKDPNDRNTI